ncbi:hypothetical protein GCM10029964_017630 [Kibdelosporangium lantanae]
MSRSALVIGRDREVVELTRAIDAARASRGGAVFLVGEPGIGKSRLAAEAAGLAFAAGVRVLRGRGSTIGPTVPFRPLTEALLALFRSGRIPDDPMLSPYLPILGRLIPTSNSRRQTVRAHWSFSARPFSGSSGLPGGRTAACSCWRTSTTSTRKRWRSSSTS